MTSNKWAIGVDLGGTKIEAAHVDEDGSVRNTEKVKTDVSGGEEAIQKQIEELAGTLIEKAPEAPVALGIGVAGQIDKQTGAVSYAPNLKWHDVPLDDALEKQLDIPVTVLNDVRAATWGEWLHGAGQGCRDMICIFVGTGVGGGIVSEGRVLEGTSNAAGEIGHMTVMLDGPECHCDNKGCLEALAGSWAIERDARKAVKNQPDEGAMMLKMAGGDVENVKAKTVINAYHEHDPLAKHLIDDVVNALAAGLAGLTNALNPERIIMGGGVIDHLPELVPMIEKKIRQRALDAVAEPLEVVPTKLRGKSGVIGAAAYTIKLNQ